MRRHIELTPGLRADQIDEKLCFAKRAGEVYRRVMAYYLVELRGEGRFQQLGFPDVKTYGMERLGLSYAQVRDLLLVGRALLELHLIDQAFARGRISWSQTRLLARICVPETQEAWLAFAHGCSLRKLEEEVARSQKGKNPGEGLSLPPLRYRICAVVTPLTHELWERVQKLLDDERGSPVLPREALHTVFEHFLARRTLAAPTPVQRSREHSEQDLHGETEEGLRREILTRDGSRCCHCGSEHRLHVHHLQWRSRGGETRPSNLCTLCDRCHRLVHEGLLVVGGSIREGLTFFDRTGTETGIRPEVERDLTLSLPVVERPVGSVSRETRARGQP